MLRPEYHNLQYIFESVMAHFSTTSVELSTTLLDRISGTLNEAEKCHILEQDLKCRCPSITLQIKNQDHLELCGQWHDIVNVQAVLDTWVDRHSVKTENLQRQKSTNDRFSIKIRQVAAPEMARLVVVPEAPEADETVKLKGPSPYKRETINTRSSISLSTRPKRNIKHTILPLLKSQRSRFDQTISSDNTDDDSNDNSDSEPFVSPEQDAFSVSNSTCSPGKKIVEEELHGSNTNKNKVNVNEQLPVARKRGRPRHHSIVVYNVEPPKHTTLALPNISSHTNNMHESDLSVKTNIPQRRGRGRPFRVKSVKTTCVDQMEHKPNIAQNEHETEQYVKDEVQSKSRSPLPESTQLKKQLIDNIIPLAFDENDVEIIGNELTNSDLAEQDIDAQSTFFPDTKPELFNPEENTTMACKEWKGIVNPRVRSMIVVEGLNFHCSQCEYQSISLANIRLHVMRTHIPKIFQCEQCGKRYGLKKDYMSHIAVHTKPYQCQLCTMSFAKPYILRKHIRNRHEGTPKKRGRKPSVTKNQLGMPFRCEFCEYMSFSRRNHLSHIQRVHADKIYKCSHCDRTFAVFKDLSYHRKTRHGSRECHICKKILKNNYCLQMHTKVIHDGVKVIRSKKYQCDKCGKVCRNKTDYTAHTNKMHLNIRPFKCDTCGMEFFANSNLAAHLLIHKEEASFICPDCGKCFKQRQGLRAHCNIHKAIEDRPFKCSICGRVFTQRGALNRHQRVHTGLRPYLCKFDVRLCSAAFSDYSTLRRHLQGFHKVQDLDFLRRAVQQACDESRQVFADEQQQSLSKDMNNGDIQFPVSESKNIALEQRLQARNLRNNKRDEIRKNELSIMVKLEREGVSTEDIQFTTQLQRNPGIPGDVKVLIQTNTSIKEEVQDLFSQFQSPDTEEATIDSEVQYVAVGEVDQLPESMVKVMYLTEEGSIIEAQDDAATADQESQEHTPEHIEQTVSETFQQQSIEHSLPEDSAQNLEYIDQVVLRQPFNPSRSTEQKEFECPHVVEPLEGNINLLTKSENDALSVLTANNAVVARNCNTVSIKQLTMPNLRNLLQAPLVSSSGSQVTSLQSLTQGKTLHAIQERPTHARFSTVPLPSIVFQQAETAEHETPINILPVHHEEETEHVIVITNVPEDQHPDINTILSLHQQGSLGIYQDQPGLVAGHVLAGQEILNTNSSLTYNEAASVLGMLMPQVQDQNPGP